MAHRKNVKSLSSADLTKLRALLDQYISKANDNPVAEHRAAGHNMALMIHGMGFLAWHSYFLAKAEIWFLMNGGAKFVPLPMWNPADAVPPKLSKGNTSVFMPLPASLRGAALKQVSSYKALNTLILPYHGNVHDGLGGNMPDPEISPSDPIFWPFHAFLVSVYERWRTQ
jgi:hypothetical protein